MLCFVGSKAPFFFFFSTPCVFFQARCRQRRGLPPRRACQGLPPLLSDAEDASRALLSGVREVRNTRELACTSSWLFQNFALFFIVLDEGVDFGWRGLLQVYLGWPCSVLCACLFLHYRASVATWCCVPFVCSLLCLLGSWRPDSFMASVALQSTGCCYGVRWVFCTSWHIETKCRRLGILCFVINCRCLEGGSVVTWGPCTS